MTATAAAGPSGVYGIDCSVDGAAGQWYPTSSAQVPSAESASTRSAATRRATPSTRTACTAPRRPRRSRSSSGSRRSQRSASTSSSTSCAATAVTERVRIPARWVTVNVHHQRVRVHERAHIQRVRVTRCHVRTARRRVTVWVTVAPPRPQGPRAPPQDRPRRAGAPHGHQAHPDGRARPRDHGQRVAGHARAGSRWQARPSRSTPPPTTPATTTTSPRPRRPPPTAPGARASARGRPG